MTQKKTGQTPSPETHRYAMLPALLADESGQDLVEYALIIAVLGLGCVATMKGIATSLATFFGGLGNTLTSAV